MHSVNKDHRRVFFDYPKVNLHIFKKKKRMLLLLLIVPIIGVFTISAGISFQLKGFNQNLKTIALTTSTINLLLSLMVFILFDFSSNLFQFVQEYHEIGSYEFYLGVDGLSIYFVLLTTVIIPIALLSN